MSSETNNILAVSAEDIEKAEQFKSEANECFKSKSFYELQ